MKNLGPAFIVLLTALFASSSFAAEKTATTQLSSIEVKGTVVDIKNVKSSDQNHGIHLTLKTASELLNVHLGPKAFIQRTGLNVRPGEEIMVVGVTFRTTEIPQMTAQKVKRGKKTWKLRDKLGHPVWK